MTGDGATGGGELRQRCLELLDGVREGRVDPSSPQAQQLLFAGLMRGWISKQEADEAADAYWTARAEECLEEVEAGQRDPKDPETSVLLDLGERSRRFTKKRRRAAEAAYRAKKRSG